MTQVIITRNQFERLREVFDQYDLDRVVWSQESKSGIGQNVTIEFDPKANIKLDITDVSSW